MEREKEPEIFCKDVDVDICNEPILHSIDIT